MGTLLRPATPIPSRRYPSKWGWLSSSRQTFEFSSHQLLKKLPAREGRRQPLIAPIEPTPPRVVTNEDGDSVTRNINGNANNWQTAGTLGDRNYGLISALYTNARCIIAKFHEILAYIATKEPDVIAITETWANFSHLMTEFSVSGYESFHKNKEHKNGSWVICYVKSTLSAWKTLKQDAKNYDSVYVEINTKSNNITIATIYRPPKSQAAGNIALSKEIKSVIQNKQAVIIGDFNCPNIDWDSMNGDREGNRLIEMVEDAFLTQIVTRPTRENNILDLVLTSDPDVIRYLKVGEKLDGNDHHFIRFKVKTKYTLADNKTKIPDYKKAKLNRARQVIPPAATWNQLNFTHADTAWTDFKSKLLAIERETALWKQEGLTVPLTHRAWQKTKGTINREKRNYSLLKQQAMAEAGEHYHRSLRESRTLIRKIKRNYEKKTASEAKGNPKRFFTYIKTKKKTKSNVGPLADENGVVTQDNKQVAWILNKNSASVFTVEITATVLPKGIEPWK